MADVARPDLHGVLAVLDAADRSQPMPGHFAAEVLLSLASLVDCDQLSYVDMDVAACTTFMMDDCEGGRVSSLATPCTDPDDAFFRHYAATPSCSYPTLTGDHRTVTMRSDFTTDKEWLQSPMYLDCLAEHGVRSEMMCPLPSTGTRTRRLLFFRTGSQEFTDLDRSVLVLLRPHLVEVLRRSSAPAGRAPLTPRQRELMQLVAAGRSNAQIATLLFLSPHTVRKHLENVFQRLEVSSRTEAVARVSV